MGKTSPSIVEINTTSLDKNDSPLDGENIMATKYNTLPSQLSFSFLYSSIIKPQLCFNPVVFSSAPTLPQTITEESNH